MSRKFGGDALMTATKAAVWAEHAGALASLGLKVVEEGAFDVPAPKQLATHMNQVVVQYGQLLGATRDKARKCYNAKHELELFYIRLLGNLEPPETLVRQGGELLAELFLQGDFKLPGYTPVGGVYIDECYVTGFQVQDGFPLGEDVHAEVAALRLYIAASCYEHPFPTS